MIVFRPNVRAYMPGVDIVNRPVVADGGETWADYANTVFDSLLAVEFRGASSLAQATLYGSAPSIVQQPGGGLVLGANGLECSSDTVLDTGKTGSPDFFILYNNSAADNDYIIGHRDVSASNMRTFLLNTTYYQWRLGSGDHAVFEAPPSTGNVGVIDGYCYLNGSLISTESYSAVTSSLYIGAWNNNGTPGNQYAGNIAAVCIGTLKVGADADTVASELYTRMQTAAL